MALKKLPLDLQSKFRASYQIRTFTTAVEELVFNALDANASSIAIRVDIKENYIQVVDNGHGVAKGDFTVLGERYTTSKFEKSTLPESVQTYGCYGQSLANLIEVSQNVKIISKYINNEETWMKHFCNGREEACSITTERPSVGTTVEINGFLYNLTIQKKAVKVLQELQNIKSFLEQMALIHCNTSISLRDNSVNEIIFQIHKNRDVIKTLASVLSICTSSLKEFHVEKNEYKVTGFIQNNNKEAKGYQWIYVNGRFINNSSLHKMVNGNLAKGVPVRKIIKTKAYNKDEEEKAFTKNKLPDYFIFIKCPKNDYELVYNYKQSVLEFKNVIHINKLLDKLVKFYMNEINLIKVTATNKEPFNTIENSKVNKTDTRSKVKQIMQKLLGSQQKKINSSNLHNGVKGKIMRRKVKTERGPLVKAKLKFEERKDTQGQKLKKNDHTQINRHNIDDEAITPCLLQKNKPITKKKIANPKPNHQPIHDNNETLQHVRNNIPKKKSHHIKKKTSFSFQVPVSKYLTNNAITNLHLKRKNNKVKHVYGTKFIPQKTHTYKIGEQVLSKFEKETEVHNRCNRLAKKVDHMLKVKKRRYKIFTHETIQYSNIVTNNKSISVRKKMKEIILHEYVPLAQKHKAANKKGTIWNDIKKSNDLLHPVTKIITHNYFDDNVKREKILAQPQRDIHCLNFTKPRVSNIPGPTYESHGYLEDTQITRPRNDLVEKCKKKQFISKTSRDNLASPADRKAQITRPRNDLVEKCKKKQFISKTSRDNLASPADRKAQITRPRNDLVEKCKKKQFISKTSRENLASPDRKVTKKQKIEKENLNNLNLSDVAKSSYSIYFTKTNPQICQTQEAAVNASHVSITNDNNEFCTCNTYSIARLDKSGSTNNIKLSSQTCIMERDGYHSTNGIRTPELHEYSEQSTNVKNLQNCIAVTGDRLENNVVFISNSQYAHIGTNSIELIDPIRMCEAVIGSCDNQKSDDIIENTFVVHSTNKTIDGNIEIKTREPNEFERESKRNEDDSTNDCLNDALNAAIACKLDDISYKPDAFDLTNRRRYIPKGMSPIFQLCNSKKVFNCELDTDYFETTVYNNFAQNVQIHTEIFEPKIQYVKDAATRDIQRVDIKRIKDNACLTFNTGSLRNAKILGQVDCKFIATVLNGGSNYEHLVLFDQHAIHERIRLEQNMSDYIIQDQWKSISVEGISLKLSRDEILYLHNYREKFERLGLQWFIANDTQVLVNAIPEAILGKHPRQVDIVLNAVNSLIREEISIMKEQGGCVSLYPKSIMNLVFSEACRYAIMFGTVLTGRECSSLVEELSRCRTPFQCAHGRPALAVLVDVAQESRPYTVNFKKVQQFREIRNKQLNSNTCTNNKYL